MESTGEPSRKRRRLSTNSAERTSSTTAKNLPRSLASSISPPPLGRHKKCESSNLERSTVIRPEIMRSPFQLTWIRDLPESSNHDAVTLKEILGDPLIAECWEFNYLHDLDFLMDQFDSDVRNLVKVNVVHGFWKQEDHSRQRLKLQAEKYPNVTLHTAFMPEMFGTHHSKMLVLFRHDSTAQIIIHTANMIAFDWTNMAQALWRSPPLPLIDTIAPPVNSEMPGSGSKFKTDLLRYLRAYDIRRVICKPLADELLKYDFSEIHAALVASVPGRQNTESNSKTLWGWPGLQKLLSSVPVRSKEPEIIAQMSSIASLGPTDKWLDQTFLNTLATSKESANSRAVFRIVFPTADEIRRSLNGYQSGSAIHTKIQTPAQIKQLQYLKPLLCHWAGDGAQHSQAGPTPVLDAGRKRAAPHIKTYIRFSDSSRSSVDWMLVTSANLSKQAWGESINTVGEVRVSSYEIGVIVWPELFGERAKMVPTFKTDTPDEGNTVGELVIGARMPYDLPPIPYAKDDLPWCATASYQEPDWLGMTYHVE